MVLVLIPDSDIFCVHRRWIHSYFRFHENIVYTRVSSSFFWNSRSSNQADKKCEATRMGSWGKSQFWKAKNYDQIRVFLNLLEVAHALETDTTLKERGWCWPHKQSPWLASEAKFGFRGLGDRAWPQIFRLAQEVVVEVSQMMAWLYLMTKFLFRIMPSFYCGKSLCKLLKYRTLGKT